MLKARVISCLALISLLKQASSLNCSSNKHHAHYEPFPKNVTPAQFHTRMEITLSNRNETAFVDEKYDAVNQRGYVTILAKNSSWEVHYDHSENEIDHVIDEDCWSYNWTETRLERLKCLYRQTEGSLDLIGDVCSATIVLDLAYKNKTAEARFLGRKVVRNIPVKGWRICKSNTALDFWFTVPGWYHSTGDFPVPVLVEARPADAASELTGGLVHSYTFLDFFHDEPGFKVPKVFWCQGAFDPPPLPTLPRRFDVNLESLNTDSSRIRGVREYYDLDKQLFRIDFDARGRLPPRLGTGPCIDIRDKKTGKATRHNRKTGRCEDFQLGKPRFMASKHHYRIDVPFGKLALFEDPTSKPAYRGRARTRQIVCDVWQQKRVNWPENFSGEMVWRWYFNRRNRMKNKEAKPVPVKLEIEGQIQLNATFKEEFEFNVNLYAFESKTPTPNAFDVSAICATKSSKQEKRFSSGAVAGISVVCIVVGLLLGTAIVFVLVKKHWLPRRGPLAMRFP